MNLPYEEDFIIILLRVGVASLEAAGLRGWTNEVAPIQRPGVRPRRLRVPGGQRSGLGLVPEDTYRWDDSVLLKSNTDRLPLRDLLQFRLG